MKTFIKHSVVFCSILGVILSGVIVVSHMSDRNIFLMDIQLSKWGILKQGKNWRSIIMGDSRGLAMNKEKAVADQYDLFNFCTVIIGGIHPYCYFLRTYLKYNNPPKVIFMTFLETTFSTDSGLFRQPPIAFGDGQLYRASRYYSLAGLFTEPIFKQFSSVRWQVLATRLFPNKCYVKILEPLWLKEKYLDMNTGFAAINGKHVWKPTEPVLDEMSRPYVPSALHIESMREFLAIAKEHGIEVVIVHIPTPQSLYDTQIQTGFFTEYFAILDRLSAEFPDTLKIGNKPYPYPDELFSDYHHLNDAGAERYNSAEFLELLEKYAGK